MADPRLPAFVPNQQSAVAPFFFMHEGVECVKVMIAGETRFAPVFRAADMYEMDGLQEVTYADRWPEQYRQFKEGASQIADGTPLDEAPFLNPSRIAELRQLKIYSIEALANLDDRNIPRLGGKGYDLKILATDYLAKRREKGADDKIAAMAAQIEALQAQIHKPAEEAKWTQVTDVRKFEGTADPVEIVPNPFPESYADLKETIKAKTGSYPRGNPSLETLQRIVAELSEE